MAKLSSINKNNKRIKLVNKFYEKRKKLKKIIMDKKITLEERFKAQMKLSKLPKIIKMRKDNANYLSSRISKHPEIEVPIPKSGSDHIYQMYTIKLKTNEMRDKLQAFLTKHGIFSKIYFSPIHLTQFYIQKFNLKQAFIQ